MVFKRLMQAMGVGGPEVETVLHDPNTVPGGMITGEVSLRGGTHDSYLSGVYLALRTRVEVESRDHEYNSDLEYAKLPITSAFALDSGTRRSFPFRFRIPWEAPLTHFYGQRLYGTTVGLATEVEVTGAVDATDLDPLAVHPLPAQDRILAALAGLGFRFRNADCEKGRIRGMYQELPFYQEIEFLPPPRFAQGITQLEVTFVSSPRSMEVVFELDRRGGFLTEGHDSFSRFTVDYATADRTDWQRELEGYLQHACRRRGFF
ncbi:sporulation protein [Pseudonocardia sp. DSM 110487]|uniref:sporulation protein n=1 Tax=Pseudonocardia sp. DSM 110487 TaxID=2865833 RepID=UPI001C694E06|nr:sporulation protein [Pseudonocardia sp. DSM 110487]QYN34736.1 sporulation protein [Pseudonocardia sp. DSM 110487]